MYDETASGAPIFANGARTAAFSYLFSSAGSSVAQNGLAGLGRAALDVAGKIWNLPNTAIGTVIGGIGNLFGGTVGIANNAIEFRNNALMDALNPDGAITFGNTTIYGSNAYSTASHETIHTYIGQFVGPAYIPLNVVGMALSVASYPITPLQRIDAFHGRLNFMEGSPFSGNLYGQGP